jgi:hypothetical protein
MRPPPLGQLDSSLVRSDVSRIGPENGKFEYVYIRRRRKSDCVRRALNGGRLQPCWSLAALNPKSSSSSVQGSVKTMAVLARTAPPLAGTGHWASTSVLPSASLSFAAASSRPRGRLGLSAAGTGRVAGARRRLLGWSPL